MANFELWAINVPFLEQWTNELVDKLEDEFDVPGQNILIRKIDNNNPRVAKYGYTNFPCLVAVKYGQPFRKIIGKREYWEYQEWAMGLNWVKERIVRPEPPKPPRKR
jgi:hypothetical protein